MGKRAARCYRRVKGHSYTRVSTRRQSKSYIKGVPGPQIRVFDMGTQKTDYDMRLDLVSTDSMRIRHSALEACRISANKYLDANIGTEEYFFKIRVYPQRFCVSTQWLLELVLIEFPRVWLGPLADLWEQLQK
jgi:large subunit ribosomal protein L10e